MPDLTLKDLVKPFTDPSENGAEFRDDIGTAVQLASIAGMALSPAAGALGIAMGGLMRNPAGRKVHREDLGESYPDDPERGDRDILKARQHTDGNN